MKKKHIIINYVICFNNNKLPYFFELGNRQYIALDQLEKSKRTLTTLQDKYFVGKYVFMAV